MQIKEIGIDEIVPYARNPRHNQNAVDKVAASIKEFGFQQPIVIDKNNIVIVGHTRLLAAKKLGFKKVPVHIAENLNDIQVKAYRLIDNKSNEYASWENELLNFEINELIDGGYNLINEFDFNLGNEKKIEKDEKYKQNFSVLVNCEDEADQEAVYKMLTAKGYQCKIMSI